MRQFTSGFRLHLEPLDARLVPAVLFVDDDKAQRPTAGYTSIQAAVDAAAPGDTVRVYAGTYREQVRVDKRLTLESVREHAAVIEPPAAGLPAAGNGILVTVTGGARGVVIDGFWVRGTGTPAGNVYAGIGVGGGASAAVRDNLVTDIAAPDSQDGLGILVQGADAVVSDNTVLRYQKAGVVAFGPGDVTIRGNTVVGAGPTAATAQNGIQASDGVNALIAGNTVTGNVFTPAGTEGVGVLVLAAGRVTVADNRLAGNELGVAAVDQTAGLLVTGNRVLGSTLDGISVATSRNVAVLGNRVTDSGRDGISLTDTNNSVVLDNRVTDSGRWGIALTGSSANNLVAFNRVSGSRAFDLFDDTPAGSGNVFVGNRFRTRN